MRIGALVALLVGAGIGLAALGGPVWAALALPTGVPTMLEDGDFEIPLQEHDLPPAGVAASLGFATPGLVGCSLSSSHPTLKPDEVVWLGTREVAEEFLICLDGFAPDRDVDAEVMAGDRVVLRLQIAAVDQAPRRWTLALVPGDPLGAYVVTASQGDRAATGVMWVQAAEQPRILVLPRAGPPGTRFRIAVAGFPPGDRVDLHLYRLTRGDVCSPLPDLCWRYATTLETGRIDERGEATVTLRTRSDDPPNSYRVISDPAGVGADGFIVSP